MNKRNSNRIPIKNSTTPVNLSVLVRKYLQASLSENTRIAYINDLAHFMKWGGHIPTNPESIAAYLADHAEKLSFATLSRRVVAIGKAHVAKGVKSPTQSELVKATLHGIRRINGKSQRRVKPAQLHDVQEMVDGLEGAKGLRDKALLLIGFAGAFRRSELVSLQVKDVHLVAEGIVINLRRSKTDQIGKGRDIAIPRVRGKYCPVKALREWLNFSGIVNGAIFRRVSRYGQVMNHGLSGPSVALIVKQHAKSVGLDASQYSGHSLRAGFVTSAAKSGVSSWKICQQTGHQSSEVMQRYIRDSHLFVDNPLGRMW